MPFTIEINFLNFPRFLNLPFQWLTNLAFLFVVVEIDVFRLGNDGGTILEDNKNGFIERCSRTG